LLGRLRITRKEYIGDIPVKGIELFFVDNKLSKVEVFFDLSYSQNLFDACKSAFGEPTGNNIPKDNSMRFLNSSERHYWEAQKVRLTHSYSNRISGANGPKLKLIFESMFGALIRQSPHSR
jgi:hypothetical protein